MKQIKNILLNLFAFFVILPIFGAILNIWLPGIKDVTLFLVKIVFQMFVQFELSDLVMNIAIYLLLGFALSSLGIYYSSKTDNKIWEIVAIIVSIIGLLSGSLL